MPYEYTKGDDAQTVVEILSWDKSWQDTHLAGLLCAFIDEASLTEDMARFLASQPATYPWTVRRHPARGFGTWHQGEERWFTGPESPDGRMTRSAAEEMAHRLNALYAEDGQGT